MKYRALLDESSAAALDIAWLAQALAPVSAPGARISRTWAPFVRGEEARAQAAVDAAARAAMTLKQPALAALRGVLGSCPDPLAIAQRVSAGDVLEDADFFELARFCDAVEAVRAYNDAALALLPVSVAPLREVLRPGRRAAGAFYLDDAFEPALAAARVRASERQAAFEAARGRLLERVARGLERDDLREHEFIIMRDAARGPLPEHVRVVRETPAYFLCEIDLDEDALAALARRDAALTALAAAEDAARERLSASVREHAALLVECADQMGAFDLFLARVLFAQRYQGVAPEIVAEGLVAFEDARFLPLQESLERRGRAYTPLSFALRGVAVITGPNMGGKSAALQTCGFIAVCAAWGVPVPAAGARVGLFSSIVRLAGGAEDPQHDVLLSAFGREVAALRQMLAADAGRTLVLVDEFARTTNPREARALSVALAKILTQRGATALLASHLDGLAQAAGVAHFAVAGLRSLPDDSPTLDLAQALALIGDAMDYRIVRVGAESPVPADAIALAALLGLGEDFIGAARAALSRDAD